MLGWRGKSQTTVKKTVMSTTNALKTHPTQPSFNHLLSSIFLPRSIRHATGMAIDANEKMSAHETMALYAV